MSSYAVFVLLNNIKEKLSKDIEHIPRQKLNKTQGIVLTKGNSNSKTYKLYSSLLAWKRQSEQQGRACADNLSLRSPYV